jgi:aspartyl-tRNA(Asn)/glutamyl-tRNA(Gln) amidotransferase subunit A
VKDLFDTAGLPTTYGSAVFADRVPDETAAAVRALEEAGWALAGKANLHEFAYGTTSENPHYGTVPNPRFPGRVAGGSSGGSAAAVAAGLAGLGLGTDSGGSVRIPAACCGVAGFKPTFGLVPLDGCFPLAPSFDHAGPIAATAAACEAALEQLTGRSPRSSPPALLAALEELRAGVAWVEEADAEVASLVAAAAARFPDRRPVALPPADDTYPAFMREVADVHRELLAENGDLYGEDVRLKVERCLAVSDAEAAAADRARGRYAERVDEALDGLDLLLTPTLPCVPPLAGRGAPGDLDVRESLIRFTYPWNATGRPALALPCGLTGTGLPASVQLVGARGADGLVLAAGRLLERELGATASARP